MNKWPLRYHFSWKNSIFRHLFSFSQPPDRNQKLPSGVPLEASLQPLLSLDMKSSQIPSTASISSPRTATKNPQLPSVRISSWLGPQLLSAVRTTGVLTTLAPQSYHSQLPLPCPHPGPPPQPTFSYLTSLHQQPSLDLQCPPQLLIPSFLLPDFA